MTCGPQPDPCRKGQSDKDVSELKDAGMACGNTIPECTLDDIMVIARGVCDQSGGKLRLAYQEQDDDSSLCAGGEHFIKLDEKRLSQDLSRYVDIDAIFGPGAMAQAFFEDAVAPLKNECPECCVVAKRLFTDLGERLFQGEIAQEWRELLDLLWGA